ncbi:MAG: tol-pal system protein YbgF [Nitrospirota bacterium]|nr:tol-pal system protein YbgF [Nitrospirota bacterium]MDH5585320.1 tol-pal system protein YbgF [Nitrospirota bacterium]MDH5774147.1 tol-pal system protein YbgF [Nitrospirota bacterium]
MNRTFLPLILLGTSLAIGGCATEPNLTDLQKQVQTLSLQQEATQQQEKQARDRLAAIESQLDEHDFLVGELIKTEEESNLDTRHLLEKLERTSAMLREQIEQTRISTQRRDQDLSIRVKAIEARIDNMVHRPQSGSSQISVPVPSKPVPEIQDASPTPPTQTQSSPEKSGVENEASAFRSAYKIYLKGNYDRASAEFQRFVKHYPSTALTPQAFYYLGQSYYEQKHYDPAQQALQHVVRDFPNTKYRSQALVMLGQIMIETQQRSKAQELWKQIIQDYPGSPDANHAKDQLKKAGLS